MISTFISGHFAIHFSILKKYQKPVYTWLAELVPDIAGYYHNRLNRDHCTLIKMWSYINLKSKEAWNVLYCTGMTDYIATFQLTSYSLLLHTEKCQSTVVHIFQWFCLPDYAIFTYNGHNQLNIIYWNSSYICGDIDEYGLNTMYSCNSVKMIGTYPIIKIHEIYDMEQRESNSVC